MRDDARDPSGVPEEDSTRMPDSVSLVALVFQQVMGLDFGPEPVEDQTPPRYRPGPIDAGAGGLASRRLDAPLARLHYAAVAAELALFPLYEAVNEAERDRINREIGQVLALDRAVQAGLIRGWLVCWSRKEYPKRPSSVRLFSLSGRGGREKALGEMAPQLRQFIDAMKATGEMS